MSHTMSLRAVIVVLLCLAMPGLYGCGGNPQTSYSNAFDASDHPVQGIEAVFSPAGVPGISRTISEANNYVCGRLYWLKDAQAEDGEAAVLLDGAGAPSWVVYSWNGLSADNLPVKVSFELVDIATEYWVGIANFDDITWEIQGPFGPGTAEVDFTGGAEYVSAAGESCIALIVADGHAATVRWVNLVTSLGADRVYVDPAHEGVEDGSFEYPFNTIDEGVAAATAGQVVVLAPGDYDPADNITIDKALTFEGAGAGCTIVNGGFLVDVPVAEGGQMVFNGINCHFVHFALTDGEKIPIRIQHCAVLGLFIDHPADHDFLIDNSVIIGDEDGDGSITVLGDVWDVSDGVVVEFNHLEGTSSNTVSNCRITGDLKLSMGSGTTNLITGNTCYGNLIERSGNNMTTISYNEVIGGSIFDNSGGENGVEDGIIEYNTVTEGMIRAVSNSITIRGNTVSWTTPPMFEDEAQNFGISASCGSPTNVVDNTVTIPYTPAVFVDVWSIEDRAGLIHVSGPGVVSGNTITGGAYGIVDRSGATEFSGNEVTGAHYGIATAGVANYSGNLVHGCTSTGVIFDTYDSAFSGNTIRDNGGDGVTVVNISSTDQTVDMGGGHLGCTGGNVITGNAEYGLVIGIDNTVVAEVFAQNNFWGETTQPLITENCIYDGNDESGLATVSFEPFLTAEP